MHVLTTSAPPWVPAPKGGIQCTLRTLVFSDNYDSMPATLFLFDLDGTLTRREILPELAAQLDLDEEIRLLTRLTLEGVLGFPQSLRLRFAVLRILPLRTIHEIIAAIPLEPALEEFIRARPKQCALATGNVDAWIRPIVTRLGCTAYCTRSTFPETAQDGTEEDIPPTEQRLLHILDKGELARSLKRTHRLVVVGDSDNDLPMLREADISIAFSAAHAPLPQVCSAATYMARHAGELRRLLEHLASIGEDQLLCLPDWASQAG